MKMRWACILPVLTLLTCAIAPSRAFAQGYPAGPTGYGQGLPPGYQPDAPAYAPAGAMSGAYMPQGMAPQGMQGLPPGMMQPGGMVAPANYAQGGPSPMEIPAGTHLSGPTSGYPGMDEGCQQCGGSGCDSCGRRRGGGGLLGDLIGVIGPYGEGGCSAPRWYDINVDFMSLKRDRVSRNVNFSSLGIGGPIVLGSDDLRFFEAPGFRFQSMIQMGAGSNLEFTYFGTFAWNSHAAVTAPANNLFSALSQFGNLPFNGFAESDNGVYHELNYYSTFDNYEVNYRNRWTAPNCRYQGSWLMGVRHFGLKEKLNYDTSSTVNNANMNYYNADINSLTGFQIGGDAWMCLLPGLRIGGELKAGIYNNRINQTTVITATSIPNGLTEKTRKDSAAFLGQGELMMTYRLNQQWTLKGGYQFLVVDGVALATENFNPTPPNVFFGNVPPPGAQVRTAKIVRNGDILYHGYSLGAEYLW